MHYARMAIQGGYRTSVKQCDERNQKNGLKAWLSDGAFKVCYFQDGSKYMLMVFHRDGLFRRSFKDVVHMAVICDEKNKIGAFFWAKPDDKPFSLTDYEIIREKYYGIRKVGYEHLKESCEKVIRGKATSRQNKIAQAYGYYDCTTFSGARNSGVLGVGVDYVNSTMPDKYSRIKMGLIVKDDLNMTPIKQYYRGNGGLISPTEYKHLELVGQKVAGAINRKTEQDDRERYNRQITIVAADDFDPKFDDGVLARYNKTFEKSEKYFKWLGDEIHRTTQKSK